MIQHIFHEMKFIGIWFWYIEERVCKKGLSFFFGVINIIPHNLVLLVWFYASTICDFLLPLHTLLMGNILIIF